VRVLGSSLCGARGPSQGGCRTRSRNRKIGAVAADHGSNSVHLLGDVLTHTLDFLPFGGIVKQELLREPNRAERQTKHFANVAVLRDGDFATAASEIEHQHIFFLDAHVRKHAQVNEPPFFQTGDDLDLPSHG
jgi:hypothetical protein